VLAVNKLATDLVARCRKGEGPFFIELMTYRYHGHHVGDINRAYYRSKEEEAEWKDTRDPIMLFGDWLEKEGIASEGELAELRDAVMAEAREAVDYALSAPYPDGSEVGMHVFAEAS
jgi:pyruvate dehydrogenase E1 component alpha subunit